MWFENCVKRELPDFPDSVICFETLCVLLVTSEDTDKNGRIQNKEKY